MTVARTVAGPHVVAGARPVASMPAPRRRLLSALAAPLVYSLLVPIAVLDLWVTLYQQVCFRIYGIARVRRADFMRIDRHLLPYLDAIDKANCVYCGYGNGVIAYAREIASRTEQYWCPIKHSTPPKGVHARYERFLDFGDGEQYREKAEMLREKLRAGK